MKVRRITDSTDTKSTTGNTGKNSTATHQLDIHKPVLSTMPSENYFMISKSKLVVWWHFISLCLTT